MIYDIHLKDNVLKQYVFKFDEVKLSFKDQNLYFFFILLKHAQNRQLIDIEETKLVLWKIQTCKLTKRTEEYIRQRGMHCQENLK